MAKNAIGAVVLGMAGFSAVGQARAQSQGPAPADIQALAVTPTNLDAAMATARAAAASGRPREAIAILERILRIEPGLDNIRLEIASLYLAAGSPEIASIYATAALNSPTIPAETAARARSLLADAQKGSSSSLLQGGVTAGLRYDSNANQATSLGLVGVYSPLLGPIQVPPGVAARGDGSAVLSADVYFRHDLGLQRAGDWEASASVYTQRYFRVNDQFDLTVVSADTGPRLGIGDLGGAAVAVHPFVSGTVLIYGGQRYATFGGGGASIEARGQRFLATVQATTRYGSYASSAFRPQGALYSGEEWNAAGSFTYAIRPDTNLTGTAGYYDAQAKVGTLARSGPSVGAGLSHDLSIMGHAVQISAHGGLQVLNYSAPDSLINPFASRHDKITDAELSISAPVAKKIAIIAQYSFSNDDSNYDIYKLQNHSVSVSVRMTF